MERRDRFSAEVRDHASHGTAIRSIVEKIGCSTEAPRKWVRQDERTGGHVLG